MNFKKHILPILILAFVVWFICGVIAGYKDAVRFDSLSKTEQIQERLEMARAQLPYEEDGQIYLSIDYSSEDQKVTNTFKVLEEGLNLHNSTNTKENLKSDICSDEWIYEDIEEGIHYDFKFINEQDEVIEIITINKCN